MKSQECHENNRWDVGLTYTKLITLGQYSCSIIQTRYSKEFETPF